MPPRNETDAQLKKRHEYVSTMLAEAKRKLARIKNLGARMRQARWCGSLRFTLLQIESKLTERGIEFEPKGHD